MMLLGTVIFAIGLVYAAADNRAVVVLSGINTNVSGVVYFNETTDGLLVTGTIQGLEPGSHGFHVHALGDLTNGCTSTGSHFNPKGVTHGGRDASVRHVGDLGNIVADGSGVANFNFTDDVISLSGENDIIGRAVVVHEKADDLGLVGDEGSLSTGNAGGRVACGIIGRLTAYATSGSSANVLPNTLHPILLLPLIMFVTRALKSSERH